MNYLKEFYNFLKEKPARWGLFIVLFLMVVAGLIGGQFTLSTIPTAIAIGATIAIFVLLIKWGYFDRD